MSHKPANLFHNLTTHFRNLVKLFYSLANLFYNLPNPSHNLTNLFHDLAIIHQVVPQFPKLLHNLANMFILQMQPNTSGRKTRQQELSEPHENRLQQLLQLPSANYCCFK